ncbi:MAG: DUF924 family protein [Kofleriaceae bacterium]
MTIPAAWPSAVRRYWFAELTPAQWFRASAEVDRDVRARFGHLPAAVTAAPPPAATTDGLVALATVLVLDQFPRHIWRGHAEAFAYDAAALAVATTAVDVGLDATLTPAERSFLYLPFMHAEAVSAQARSLALVTALGGDGVAFAQEHHDVIARFGRFPHRNAVLGRTSTAEEVDFLAHAARYGQ